MTMHDQVIVALISTIGSVTVAYLTTNQVSKPSYDELKKKRKKLKNKLKKKLKVKKDKDDKNN